jgi:hypothetical protein
MSEPQIYTGLWDIKFCLYDENGDHIENENGEVKIYQIKEGIRFKPLEYIAEDLTLDMLEEVK